MTANSPTRRYVQRREKDAGKERKLSSKEVPVGNSTSRDDAMIGENMAFFRAAPFRGASCEEAAPFGIAASVIVTLKMRRPD